MVLKILTGQVKYMIFRSCKCKHKYNLLTAFIKTLIVKIQNNDNLSVYKCIYCDKYHVGHNSYATQKRTKKMIRVSKMSVFNGRMVNPIYYIGNGTGQYA